MAWEARKGPLLHFWHSWCRPGTHTWLRAQRCFNCRGTQASAWSFFQSFITLVRDFPVRCIVLTPRGWLVRHSFILTCKGRNTRSRAAAFCALPICFQWLVLSPCPGVQPQLRKTFIQHMPKSHWPEWASGLCLRFVLNQGLIEGIFFSAHLNIETQDCNTVYWNVPLLLFHQLMNLVERPSVTGCCNCGKNWTLHLSFHSVH